jgi:hypothetical protein
VAVRVNHRERHGERAFAEVNREVRRAKLRGKACRRRPHEHQADAIGGEAELRRDERGLRPAARAHVEAGGDAREEGDAARREVDFDGRDLELALDARTRLAERVDDERDRGRETQPIAGDPGLQIDRSREADAPRIADRSRSADGAPCFRGVGNQIAQRRDDRGNRGRMIVDDGLPVAGDGAERIRKEAGGVDRRDFRMARRLGEAEQNFDGVRSGAELAEDFVRDVAEHGAARVGDRVGRRQIERVLCVRADRDVVRGEDERRLARGVDREAGADGLDAHGRRPRLIDEHRAAVRPVAEPQLERQFWQCCRGAGAEIERAQIRVGAQHDVGVDRQGDADRRREARVAI